MSHNLKSKLHESDVPIASGPWLKTEHGYLLGAGTTVPTNIAAHQNVYSPGAPFIHVDGSGAATLYRNEGTYAAPSFVQLASLTGGAFTGASSFGSTLGVTGLLTASGGVSGTTGTFSGTLAAQAALTVGTTATVEGASALKGLVTLGNAATGAVVAGCGTYSSDTASTGAYAMAGAGKSALQLSIASADTGDSNRAGNFRLYLSGASGGGEALRAMCVPLATMQAVAARGLHASVYPQTATSVAGEYTGAKGTVMCPNSVTLGGTGAAVCANIWSAGNASRASNLSFFSAILDGTGSTNLGTDLKFMTITGIGAAGAGKVLQENTATAADHILKCDIDGTAYGIMLVAL